MDLLQVTAGQPVVVSTKDDVKFVGTVWPSKDVSYSGCRNLEEKTAHYCISSKFLHLTPLSVLLEYFCFVFNNYYISNRFCKQENFMNAGLFLSAS